MKEREENIIAIHNRSIDEANRAFAEFMRMTEDCFNEKSRNNPLLYKSCSPSELEKVTEQILKEVCPSTPFKESDISHISLSSKIIYLFVSLKIAGISEASI